MSTSVEFNELYKLFKNINNNIYRNTKNNRRIKKRKCNNYDKNMKMKCECKNDVTPACGETCLNRLANIECGSDCPCGEFCTNKNFESKNYVSFQPFKSQEKGYGLKTTHNIKAKTFIIEYVGEVIGIKKYNKRNKRYFKKALKHSYFMSLPNDLFIDATKKGNISRFLNHSCDPNCQAQKWIVNGELRIGIFSIRDINANEELTFNYNYKNFDKQQQKCFCGCNSCRGYLGVSNEDKNENEIVNQSTNETNKVVEKKICQPISFSRANFSSCRGYLGFSNEDKKENEIVNQSTNETNKVVEKKICQPISHVTFSSCHLKKASRSFIPAQPIMMKETAKRNEILEKTENFVIQTRLSQFKNISDEKTHQWVKIFSKSINSFNQNKEIRSATESQTSQSFIASNKELNEKICKDGFKEFFSNLVKKELIKYYKTDCLVGHIINEEDFRFLARKFTHTLNEQEIKTNITIEQLELNKGIPEQIVDYITKYMKRFQGNYSREMDDEIQLQDNFKIL